MIIEISQQPAIYTSTWTTGSSKFSGQLNANTARVQELIATGQDAFFEVKADDEVICQVPIAVLSAVAAPNSLPAHTLPGNLNDFANDPSTNGNFNASNWLTDLGSPENYAVWGNITGTLSGQTDLQSALDSKGSASQQTANTTAISNNTAKVGITSAQASAIEANTLKNGITSSQASAITNNTAKVGITSAQATAITNNTAKVGITSGQASAITDNTAKVGITTAQASAITSNTNSIYPFTTDFLGSTERTQNLTSITGTSGFKGQSTLDDIYIGSNVTSIGSYSFQYSGNFNITIAPGLTTIADSGFGSSYISGSLKLPNSVTTIGTYAFIYSTLTGITLPTNASFTTISSGAFSYSSITSLTIPDNVTTIGSSAFAYGSISSITIPNSVTSIGSSAFAFSSLSSVTLPTNASFTTIESSAFQYCGLTSITIPSNVTSIGSYALASTGLTSITIPSSVATIGSAAFRYNTSLTTINCLRMTPPTVTSGAFGYSNTTEIHVPELATGYGTTLDGLTVVKDL